MVFSMDLPFLMAVSEAPLPRWQVISFSVSKGLPRMRLASLAT